jgi:hypothetical protein
MIVEWPMGPLGPGRERRPQIHRPPPNFLECLNHNQFNFLHGSVAISLERRSEHSGAHFSPIPWRLIGETAAFESRNAPIAADAAQASRNDQMGDGRRRTRR